MKGVCQDFNCTIFLDCIIISNEPCETSDNEIIHSFPTRTLFIPRKVTIKVMFALHGRGNL